MAKIVFRSTIPQASPAPEKLDSQSLCQSADVETLAQGFRDAAASRTCRGFAVGRTIFHAPARAWLAGEIDDAGFKAAARATFEALIDAWRKAREAA